ncbi:MAG: DUF3782 domain-containing protein [Acidobacteria bacterium]|nr:DUF3782 domain-containing protein [Acidobacteriota bacterium]
MTDQELRDLIATLAKFQAETDRQIAETSREIKRVGKQIGELGNKFGGFAEGMALPSMEKVLLEGFGMTQFAPRHKAKLNGRTIEIDALAYDDVSRKEAYIVEVKSRLDPLGIDQILQTIADAPKFIPALRGLKIFGIVAAVEIPDNLRKEVIKRGLYLARISDDTFKLAVPRDFKPKDFGPAPEQNGRSKRRARKKTSRAK